MNFAAYGSVLASPVAFPELPRSSAAAEWTLSVQRHAPLPREGGWVRVWHAAGKPWLSVKPSGTGWRIRFQGLAVFDVDPRERTIDARPAPGAGPALLRHLLLDQVFPRALHAPAAPVLHASAAALPAGIAGFIGKAGRGKSTLAAAFARAGRRLFADDALRVVPQAHGFLAHPGYPGLRLGGASLGLVGRGGPRVAEGHWKRRVVPPWSSRPAPLRAVYVLQRAPRLAIRDLRGSEAVVALFGAGMRLGDGRENAAEEFEGCVRLAREVPVRTLAFPRGIEKLPEVVAAVERDVSALRGRP